MKFMQSAENDPPGTFEMSVTVVSVTHERLFAIQMILRRDFVH